MFDGFTWKLLPARFATAFFLGRAGGPTERVINADRMPGAALGAARGKLMTR
jgi:hypothetical protein